MSVVVLSKRLLGGTATSTGPIGSVSSGRAEASLGLPAEPGLERVPAPVREQGGHPRRRETKLGLLVVLVEAILVRRVRVDRLSLGLPPRDAPRRVAGRGSEREDVAHVARRSVERPLERRHPTHRATDHGGDRGDAERVEDELVNPTRERQEARSAAVQPGARALTR